MFLRYAPDVVTKYYKEETVEAETKDVTHYYKTVETEFVQPVIVAGDEDILYGTGFKVYCGNYSSYYPARFATIQSSQDGENYYNYCYYTGSFSAYDEDVTGDTTSFVPLIYYVPNGITLESVSISDAGITTTSSSTVYGYAFSEFEIQGSNYEIESDISEINDWVTLGSFTRTSAAVSDTVYDYEINAETSYKYIRMYITSTLKSTTYAAVGYMRLNGTTTEDIEITKEEYDTYEGTKYEETVSETTEEGTVTTELTKDEYDAYEGTKYIKFLKPHYYKTQSVTAFEQPVLTETAGESAAGGDEFAIVDYSNMSSSTSSAYAPYYLTDPDNGYCLASASCITNETYITYYNPEPILINSVTITYGAFSGAKYSADVCTIECSNDNETYELIAIPYTKYNSSVHTETYAINTDTAYKYIRIRLINNGGTPSYAGLKYFKVDGTLSSTEEITKDEYKNNQDTENYTYSIEYLDDAVPSLYGIKHDDKLYTPLQQPQTYYLNWVPWTQPFIDTGRDALIDADHFIASGTVSSTEHYTTTEFRYACGASNNKQVLISWDTEDGSDRPHINGAFKAFDDKTNYLTGSTEVAGEWGGYAYTNGDVLNGWWFATDSTEPETIIFYSPCYIQPTSFSVCLAGYPYYIQMLGSDNGYQFYELTKVVDVHSIIELTSKSAYDSPTAGSHWNMVSVLIPEEKRKACTYFVLRAASTGAIYQGNFRQVIFTGTILDDADWTDNETYDWELPRPTGDYSPYFASLYPDTDGGGNISVTASSGWLPALPILDPDDETVQALKSESSIYHKQWFPVKSLEDSINLNISDDTGYGWWMIKFPYKIAITKLTHTCYCNSDKETDFTGQFYADDGMTTPIGNPFTIDGTSTTGYVTTIVYSSDSPIVTDTIFLHKLNDSEYGGMSDLGIEARKLSLTDLDSSNCQFIVSTTSQIPLPKKKSGFGFFSWLILAVCVVATVVAGVVTGGTAAALIGTIGAAAFTEVAMHESMKTDDE